MTIKAFRIGVSAAAAAVVVLGVTVGLVVSDTEVGGVLGFLAGVVICTTGACVLLVKLYRLADRQETWRGMPLGGTSYKRARAPRRGP